MYCLYHVKGVGRGEMSHTILTRAMKLDSAILPPALWSPCEMSK